MTPDDLFATMSQPITCRQAASEIRGLYGLLTFGPTLGSSVRSLEACADDTHAQPRAVFAQLAADAAMQDAILALRN